MAHFGYSPPFKFFRRERFLTDTPKNYSIFNFEKEKAPDGTFIRVACTDGWIRLEELQIAGKKRLAVRELLLGWRDVLQYRFREP